MKQSLFRYVSAEYAVALVYRGEMLFRTLSYYRDYEDEGVRSDEFEGTRLHLPSDGLKLTKVGTGEVVSVPFTTFESTVREDDIFVYCMSTELSTALAEKFKTDTCVEILNPVKFLSLVRNALMRSLSVKSKHLEYGPVKYYAPHDQLNVDWALPERIALSKPFSFSWQGEHRIAYALNGAFNVGNVQLKLVPLSERRKQRSTSHAQRLLKLGNISKFCKIHRL